MAITLERIEKEETEVISIRVNKSVARDWEETMRRVSLQGYSKRKIHTDMLVNTTAQLKKALGDSQAKGYEAQAQNGSLSTDR